MTDLSGRLISSRYLIEKRLASGGMASVYLAIDTRLDRKVALKAVHPHLAVDAAFTEKFQREARVAAALSHPNLVNVFDQGQDADATYLVMEYVPGITLRDAIDQFGALDAKRAFEVLRPVSAALAAVHDSGIVHRDIKPENILLADSGAIKLSDFGLAREIANRTSAQELVGTAAYLSPELVSGGQVGSASDIYALGVVMFELVTGRQPFSGADSTAIALQHASSSVPDPRNVSSGLSDELAELILWMTAKNAKERIPDGGTLEEILKLLKRGIPVAELRQKTPATPQVQPTEKLDLGSSNDTVVLNHDSAALGGSGPKIAPELNATAVLDLAAGERSAENAVKLPRPWFKVLVSAAVAIMLGLGSGWYFGSGPGGLRAIPDLTNRTVNEAQLALSELRPELLVVEESSRDIEAGYITRTEPSSGSIFFGGTLKLFVSTGPQLVSAPNLVGLNLASAQAKILAEGFTSGAISSFFNEAPVGQVFAHTGSGGEKIGEGSAIAVSVSLGSIPVVSGLTAAAAELAIKAVGLRVSETKSEFSDTVAAGNVISLIPQAEPLGENGTVTLVVSKGPQLVTIPALVGETLLAAKNSLESLGLVVQVNTDQLSSRWGIVKVAKISPSAGATVKIGSSVTISSR